MILDKLISHINNYMIISNITLYLMSTSIIIMSIVYIVHLFLKKQLFERNMIYAGIAARILMFLGFTIEFAHQMTTYDKYRPIYNAKWDAAIQLVHFLFWGYIAVVGIYYLLTIGIKKYRGFIYTFDISMMSIPLVFGLVLGIFQGLYSGGIETLLLIPLPAACIYIFYQYYWRRKLTYFAAFFITTVITLTCAYKFKSLKLMLPFAAFMLLLGIYDLIMADLQIKIYMPLLLIPPIIFIFAANPFYNLWTLIENEQAYTVSNIFYKDVKNFSLNDMEKRIRGALDDKNDKLLIKKVSNSYIGKDYELQLGEYDIRVLGVDGRTLGITRNDYQKAGIGSISFNKAELMKKSLNFLKQLGYSYNPDIVDVKNWMKNGDYTISFYHKYTDGKLTDTFPMCEFIWNNDSRLKYLSITGVFNIKDYSEVKINESQIKVILNDFYKKLNKSTPNYVITSIREIWRSGVDITCENGDSFEIDATSGEIINYNNLKVDNKFDKTMEGTIKNRGKAINYAKAITSLWAKADFKETQLGKSYSYGQYNFIGKIPGIKITIETLVNIKGELVNFRQNIVPDNSKYSSNAFKINSKEAIKLVEERFNPFKIYTVKAALVLTTDDYNNTELKWRVGVVPFMSSEKLYYLVDVNTGMVEPVSY
ncbi:hypothetical protein [Candidatus Clostridium radicumherbarum]|uniref:PepSY domain-containing protein n=1 Tax=Candidatus Clostridium radicumherbarum TaxID=3381662 RepID=A0ABW8TUE6_9CLOT